MPSSYRAVNALRLGYQNRIVKSVYGNNRCLPWDPHKTHKYTLLVERRGGRIRIVAEGSNYLRHILSFVCLSVCQSARSPAHMHDCCSHWTDFREIWFSGLVWTSVEIIQILLKSGKNISHFPQRPKYVVLFPAKLNRRKKAVFEWNGIRTSG